VCTKRSHKKKGMYTHPIIRCIYDQYRTQFLETFQLAANRVADITLDRSEQYWEKSDSYQVDRFINKFDYLFDLTDLSPDSEASESVFDRQMLFWKCRLLYLSLGEY